MDPRSFEELGTLLQGRLQPAALLTRKIPPALCRDAIGAMIATCHKDGFPGRFGVEFEWAAEALSRLDAIQTPIIFGELDDQALFAISNSALRA
jgi:hypothetical protein